MGIVDFVKGGVQRMMIARADEHKDKVVFKHPDQTFPFWSQLTVDATSPRYACSEDPPRKDQRHRPSAAVTTRRRRPTS